MPARFRIYDDGGKGGADRYFVVDSRPYAHDAPRGPWRGALSMNSEPYHPQGIGLHIELDVRDWGANLVSRFRRWGRRITLEALPPSAQYAALDFIADSLGDGPGDALREFLRGRAKYDDHVSSVLSNPRLCRTLRTILPRGPHVPVV
jgi:hypothetical protein